MPGLRRPTVDLRRSLNMELSWERQGVKIVACLALALAALLTAADAATLRDPAQVVLFRKTHPCPATGKTTGACPGWVVDHAFPLCAGGADIPANMRWQTVEDAKVKDIVEQALCRCMKTP